MRNALVLAFFIFIAGCATIRSGSHHDEAFGPALAQYKTFAWIAGEPLIRGDGEAVAISPLTQKKIVSAIENTLKSKGYQFTDSSSADFVLAFTVVTRDKIDAKSYPQVYQGEWGWHLYGRYYYVNQTSHRIYTEGTLGVDLFDGKTNQPVWHGWASKTITTADRSDPSDSIVKGVRAVFENFPPS